MKIRPVGTKSIHADGQTDRQADMTKLVIDFRKFVKAPKNGFFDPFLISRGLKLPAASNPCRGLGQVEIMII
jgi:hypothetical protein